MTGRVQARAAAVATGALGLVLLSATAALADAAASTVDSPRPPQGSTSPTAVFTADGDVPLSATVKRTNPIADSAAVMLELTDPIGAAQTVATTTATGSSTTLARTLQSTCMYDVDTCADGTRRPGRNGTWNLALAGDGATASLTFSLTIPPAAPSGVGAKGAGSNVVVTWAANDEPDLLAYDVVSKDGTAVRSDLDPGSACNAGTCTATVTAAQAGTADETGFAVRAVRRSTPDGDRTTALTATSATAATAPLPAASSASPDPTASATPTDPAPGADPSATPGPGASPGTTAGAGGGASPTPSAGTVLGAGSSSLSLAQQKDLSQSFSSFAPTTGAPKLPPLPVLAPPAAEDDESDGDDTFSPTLTYPAGDPNDLEDGVNDVDQSAAARLAANVGLSEQAFYGSIAFGLLLAVTGGHAFRASRQPLLAGASGAVLSSDLGRRARRKAARLAQAGVAGEQVLQRVPYGAPAPAVGHGDGAVGVAADDEDTVVAVTQQRRARQAVPAEVVAVERPRVDSPARLVLLGRRARQVGLGPAGVGSGRVVRPLAPRVRPAQLEHLEPVAVEADGVGEELHVPHPFYDADGQGTGRDPGHLPAGEQPAPADDPPGDLVDPAHGAADEHELGVAEGSEPDGDGVTLVGRG